MIKGRSRGRLIDGSLGLAVVGVCLPSASVAADRTATVFGPARSVEWLGIAGQEWLPQGEVEIDLGDQVSPNSLSMKIDRVDRRGGRPYDGNVRERWRNEVVAEGVARIGEAAELGLSMNVAESRRTDTRGLQTLFAANSLEWWENSAAELELSLALADERLRLTTSQAVSNFRPVDDGPTQGYSMSQQVEAELIRTDALGLSAFIGHSVMDAEFESAGLSGTRRPWLLDRPDGRTFGFGATMTSGPVELTLSRTEREKLNEADGYREGSYDAKASLALDGLWSRLGGESLGETFWALAPDAVWVDGGLGWVDPGESGTGDLDSTQDYGFGLSWSWDGGYADLGFWRYIYDSQQQGAEDADWLGHGVYGDFGLYGDTWSIDAGLAFHRGDNEEFYSRSQDVSYDGSISFSRRSARFPDLTLGLSAGLYGTEYIAYGGDSLTDYWELNAELDFSKFLTAGSNAAGSGSLTDEPKSDGSEPRKTSLNAVYGFRSIGIDDDFSGQERKIEHFLGFIYKLRF